MERLSTLLPVYEKYKFLKMARYKQHIEKLNVSKQCSKVFGWRMQLAMQLYYGRT